MEQECNERFNVMTTAINRVSEKVFNGYGESIRRIEKQITNMEKKLNWVFVFFTGILSTLIGILLWMVLG